MRLAFLIDFLFIITVLTINVEAMNIRARYPQINSKAIQSFFKSQSSLQPRPRNEKPNQKYENLHIRRSNINNIPVYIISLTKPAQRTEERNTRFDKLFNSDGMIFLTQPRESKNQGKKVRIGRRSYDLTKKNRRKLMAIMNRELNRKLLAKANKMRRNNIYEMDFDDLVV